MRKNKEKDIQLLLWPGRERLINPVRPLGRWHFFFFLWDREFRTRGPQNFVLKKKETRQHFEWMMAMILFKFLFQCFLEHTHKRGHPSSTPGQFSIFSFSFVLSYRKKKRKEEHNQNFCVFVAGYIVRGIRAYKVVPAATGTARRTRPSVLLNGS